MKRRDGASGRDEAFRELYERNYPFILRYVRRRVNTGASAHLDVVAETFAVAWRRLDDVPAAPNDLPWLYGVARNSVLHHYRSGHQLARLRERLDAEPASSEESTGRDVETHARVRRALSTLGDLDREIVQLSFWEAMTHAQIGSAVQLSENAVELRLRRARSRLKDALTPAAGQGDVNGTSSHIPLTNEKSNEC
jgi:RNA polymerase sigma factor (sigma-70 family)